MPDSQAFGPAEIGGSGVLERLRGHRTNLQWSDYMAEPRVNLYEGMFLLNQQTVASDFAGCVQHVKDILARAEAEVLVLSKWDERRLAYEIQGQKRGTFFLSYFRARSTQIANIERDCNLSEMITRVLMIKADHIGETELNVIKGDSQDLLVEAALREGDREPARPQAAAAAASAPAPAASQD
jgi:small subunit ribosomal protein S6